MRKNQTKKKRIRETPLFMLDPERMEKISLFKSNQEMHKEEENQER